jgi:hypothetical protein
MDLAKAKKWQMAIIGPLLCIPPGALIRHCRKTSYPLIFPSVEETELHQEIQLDDFTPISTNSRLLGSSSCEDIIMNKYPIAFWMASVCISSVSVRIPAHRKLKWCRKAACWVSDRHETTFSS